MPPKPNFVLVWWIKDEESDIFETSKLPKTKRKKNDVATVIWTNHETGKDVRDQVKILEFGSKEDLMKIHLDNKGNICDSNTKLFHHPIVERKRKLKEDEKVRGEIIKKVKSDLENKLGKQAPLVSMDKPCEDQELQKPHPRKMPTRRTQVRSKKCQSQKNAKSNENEKQNKSQSKRPNSQNVHLSNTENRTTISNKRKSSNNTSSSGIRKKRKLLPTSKNAQKSFLHSDNNNTNKLSISQTNEPQENMIMNKTMEQENLILKCNNSQKCNYSNLENETSTSTCHVHQINTEGSSKLQNNIITEKNDNRSPLQESNPFSISNILAKPDSQSKENVNRNFHASNDQFSNVYVKDIPVTSGFQTPITSFFPPTYYQQFFEDFLNENNPNEVKDTFTPPLFLSSVAENKNCSSTNVFNPELIPFNSNFIDESLLDQSLNTYSNTNVSLTKSTHTSLDPSVCENNAPYSVSDPVVDRTDIAFQDTQNPSVSEKECTEQQYDAKNDVTDELNSDSYVSDDEDIIGVLHTYFSNEVTEQNVNFIRMIEASLEMMYYSKQKEKPDRTATLKLNQFKESGENKKRIAPNCNIYFPSNIVQEIEKETEIEPGISDWPKLVTLALTHVYGDHLSFYTASGRLSSQPEWARSRYKHKIRKESFVKHVNKLIQNRKGAEIKWHLNQVTEDRLHFFHNVVKTVEKAHEMYKKSLSPSRRPIQLPEEFRVANPKTHIKISANYEIHLPIETVVCIKRWSNIKNKYDWKVLVKSTLTEIYGKKLKKFCALGSSSHHPGIDSELYEALYEWANSFMEEGSKITKKDYNGCINSFTSNKRKKIKNTKKTRVEDSNINQ